MEASSKVIPVRQCHMRAGEQAVPKHSENQLPWATLRSLHFSAALGKVAYKHSQTLCGRRQDRADIVMRIPHIFPDLSDSVRIKTN
jgi:hypothetical protein